jgi:ATP-binding cassette subfamily C protein CydCD
VVSIPSARLRRGQIIAVTGPSGAGKSTLLSLLLGFQRQSGGSIQVGGNQLHEFEMDSWRSRIAWVPQHPRFPQGTIRDLVRAGRPGASDSEIEQALALAGLARGVFGAGLDTVIGEGGAGVSIGQARRIALARALIRRADLLLLDEPSAALDDLSEAEVVAAVLGEADRGAIVVVVSHHPALIRIADETIEISVASSVGAEVAGERR